MVLAPAFSDSIFQHLRSERKNPRRASLGEGSKSLRKLRAFTPVPSPTALKSAHVYLHFRAQAQSGKIGKPSASMLAAAAIKSVGKAKLGKDGISYLTQVATSGVETTLTPLYRQEILRTAKAETLLQALAGLQGQSLEKRLEELLAELAGTAKTGGRVQRIQDNLVPGVRVEDFEQDLRAGAGRELEEHFLSSRSSCALAVNAFGWFKPRPTELRFLGKADFHSLRFEKQLPTGLNGTPPHLDVWLEGRNGVIAIESKLLEYFPRKKAEISESYRRPALPQAEDCWWEVLQQSKNRRSHLGVAQLAKHYLGMKRWMDEHPAASATLVYLFWEPSDASGLAVCRQHREEIRQLEQTVAESKVNFRAMSYPELWQEWQILPALTQHVENLKARYAVWLSRMTS
jgi:hypothetical protein